MIYVQIKERVIMMVVVVMMNKNDEGYDHQ